MLKPKKSKFSYTERLAYQLGKARVGLNNPDSKIAESYNAGKLKGQELKERAEKRRSRF